MSVASFGSFRSTPSFQTIVRTPAQATPSLEDPERAAPLQSSPPGDRIDPFHVTPFVNRAPPYPPALANDPSPMSILLRSEGCFDLAKQESTKSTTYQGSPLDYRLRCEGTHGATACRCRAAEAPCSERHHLTRSARPYSSDTVA